MTKADLEPADAEQLLRTIMALSPYAKRIAPLEPDVIRNGLSNRQLKEALAKVHARQQVNPAGSLRRHLGEERRSFEAFLEQIYYSSPAFLSRVGEWPLGELRG